jgi:hypothetical protein
MAREPLRVLGETLGVVRLHRARDARVERPPPLLKEAPVRDIAGDDVIEGVLAFGIEPGFVQEPRLAESHEARLQRFDALVGDHAEQLDRHRRSDHRRGLKQALVLGGESVHARRDH